MFNAFITEKEQIGKNWVCNRAKQFDTIYKILVVISKLFYRDSEFNLASFPLCHPPQSMCFPALDFQIWITLNILSNA